MNGDGPNYALPVCNVSVYNTVRERTFDFYWGGGGGGLEDVFGPGYFSTRDEVLSFYLYMIQYVK